MICRDDDEAEHRMSRNPGCTPDMDMTPSMIDLQLCDHPLCRSPLVEPGLLRRVKRDLLPAPRVRVDDRHMRELHAGPPDLRSIIGLIHTNVQACHPAQRSSERKRHRSLGIMQ